MKKIDLTHITQFVIRHHIMIILCLITLFGAYLRFHDFTNLLRFNNDQVRDMKIIDAMITQHDFPLLGPKAGGTTFKLGPAFYYMSYVSAVLFGNTPQGMAFFVPILSTLSIILFFYLCRRYYPAYLALLLSFLYATSFYVIKYARFAWNPNVIPFFLFLFMIALLNTITSHTSKKLLWFCILGLTTGIAMQLHTTLLLILPVTIMLTYGFTYFRSKHISFVGIMIVCTLIISLLAPMLLFDLKNNGTNITAFLSGSDTKGAKRESFVTNMLLDGQFYIQSTTYIITGLEPTKNWLHPMKLITERHYGQIILAIISTVTFFFLLYMFLKKNSQPSQDTQGRYTFYLLIITITLLNFFLFLPIAHEINTRFFIIMIFLPFLLLGTLFYHLIYARLPRTHAIALIIVITCGLTTSNLLAYHRTYNLSSTENSDMYGGISLMEINALVAHMQSKTQNPSDKIHVLPHTYGQSLRYIAHVKNIRLTSTAPKNVPPHTQTFYLSDKISDTTLPKKLTPCFTINDSQIIYRFRMYTLTKTSKQCD